MKKNINENKVGGDLIRGVQEHSRNWNLFDSVDESSIRLLQLNVKKTSLFQFMRLLTFMFQEMLRAFRLVVSLSAPVSFDAASTLIEIVAFVTTSC